MKRNSVVCVYRVSRDNEIFVAIRGGDFWTLTTPTQLIYSTRLLKYCDCRARLLSKELHSSLLIGGMNKLN
jgi:hypothetical protein